MLMRLFVALPLPREIIEVLRATQNSLRQQGRGTFTRPENLHITLAFIGETENREGAVRALHTVQAPPMELTLSGIGRFGDLYWAGVTQTPALSALQQQVAGALRAERFRIDSRPFQPHLTLCRRFQARDRLDLTPVIRALGTQTWTAEEVLLMHSHRVDGVLTYTPVARQPLTARREKASN